MNPKNGVGMSAEPVVPPNDEKEIRALLRAWDNDAGRLNRADVESLAEWIHAHDYRRARPALPAPEPPPDVLDMFTRRLEVLARERSWVSNHDTRLVCEAAVGVLRAILGAALPAEHAPPDPIRILGDPILRRVAQPWAGDPGALTSRLERTMRAAGGVGLAAPQIGESVRVAVIAVSDRFVLQMVNPLIVWQSEETATELEGCLSIPGYEVPITRPVKITVDVGSNVVTLEGIQARAAQHEIDHLDGILILDRWLAQTAGIVSGSRPALAGSPSNSTEFPLRDAVDIVRLLIWREPENNAVGVKPGAALEAHALERVLAAVENERAPWYTTCDGCGQYVLCRIFSSTLDDTPTYNLCVTCIHNAARHQELPAGGAAGSPE